MATTVYKPIFLFRVYELAKSGMTESQIAKVLGIAKSTFISWEDKKPLFKMAVKEGRKAYKGRGEGASDFKEYIFNRLSPDIRKTWRKINKFDKKRSGKMKIEALLERKGKLARQHLFLYAWTSSNFSISTALKKVCLSRSTFDAWRNNDPEFARLIEEINWHKKNFFEDHLCKLIKRGDTSATIFANKTYNKDRGYNEKIDINANITGELNLNYYKMSELDLPTKTRKEILKAIQKNKKKSTNE